MKNRTVLLAALPVISFAFVAGSLMAEEKKPNTFVQMAQNQPDGMIPKAMVMGAVERTFDKVDTKKEGKLNAEQARQFQFFLKEFTRESGA